MLNKNKNKIKVLKSHTYVNTSLGVSGEWLLSLPRRHEQVINKVGSTQADGLGPRDIPDGDWFNVTSVSHGATTERW